MKHVLFIASLRYPAAMRVVVDPELCEGFGVCVKIVPDGFMLGDELPVTIKPGAVEADRARLEKAVLRCPRAALTIEES